MAFIYQQHMEELLAKSIAKQCSTPAKPLPLAQSTPSQPVPLAQSTPSLPAPLPRATLALWSPPETPRRPAPPVLPSPHPISLLREPRVMAEQLNEARMYQPGFNYVGALYEKAAQNGWPVPLFFFSVKPAGSAVFACKCHFHGTVITGLGRTKKLAKQAAAEEQCYNVLNAQEFSNISSI